MPDRTDPQIAASEPERRMEYAELPEDAGTRVVWKFAVRLPGPTGRSWIDAPKGAEFLSVGIQGDELVVWALVDADQAPGLVRLIVANTGQPVPGFPGGAQFLGTVTHANGIVWHVWNGDAETTA